MEMLLGGHWAGSSRPPGPPGIDKLTEKSQVSEDGTLRSLEAAPTPSSADGSPPEEVGEGLWPRRCGPGLGSLGPCGGACPRPSLFYWSWA